MESNNYDNYLIQFMNRENENIKKIENNVVLYGINSLKNIIRSKNSSLFHCTDRSIVNKILDLNKIRKCEVVNQFRILNKYNIYGDRLDLVKLKFRNKNSKMKLLRGTKLLKSVDLYKNISIKPDRTQYQRLINAHLRGIRDNLNINLTHRDENNRPFGLYNGKKFYWGLRNYELKKIDKV